MRTPLAQRLLAEAVGTFALVLVGTGAIAVDFATGGAVTAVGVALAFGLVVMVVIYALGDVSGAHLNPAVSAGFFMANRLSGREAAGYMASQCAGAVAASLAIRGLFPEDPTLGATLPSVAPASAFLVEIAITALLAFVIFHVVARGSDAASISGLAIGSTVALAAIFAGPLTGASMNPARSLGPALVSGRLGDLWIYWTAPFVGAVLALWGCRWTRGADCCR